MPAIRDVLVTHFFFKFYCRSIIPSVISSLSYNVQQGNIFWLIFALHVSHPPIMYNFRFFKWVSSIVIVFPHLCLPCGFVLKAGHLWSRLCWFCIAISSVRCVVISIIALLCCFWIWLPWVCSFNDLFLSTKQINSGGNFTGKWNMYTDFLFMLFYHVSALERSLLSML